MGHEGFHGRAGFGTKPALIVVDVNRGFTDPASPLVCDLEDVVAAIRQLLEEARRAEIPIVFTTVSYTEGDWLSKYSELWMFVRRTIAYQRHANAYLDTSMNSYRNQSDKWQNCRNSLLEIHKLCRQHEIPLLVVIFPFFISLDGDYPFQLIHDQVTSTCQTDQIPVLDLRETFGPFHGPELWVHPTDQHPDEQAHRLAAEAISKKIVDAGWLSAGDE